MTKLAPVLLFAAILVSAPAQASEEECQALFVQTAQSMTSDGETLTLNGVNPIIIYFCDRPVRVAGHMSFDAFLEFVSQAENSFAENPPNAAVSIFGEGDEVTAVVVTLTHRPRGSGGDLIYDIKVLEGELPPAGGPVALFIDPIGHPLSPGSIAGVHRRHERRAIRRCAAGVTC